MDFSPNYVDETDARILAAHLTYPDYAFDVLFLDIVVWHPKLLYFSSIFWAPPLFLRYLSMATFWGTKPVRFSWCHFVMIHLWNLSA
jgi:hypothetical protein